MIKTTSEKIKTHKTHVGLILDRSGSMETNLNETITGFNEQIAGLREVTDHEVRVTFTVFGTKADVRYVDRPLDEVSDLTKETYVPSGWTALYDAVGTTIMNIEDGTLIEEGDAVLIMVFSDGAENSSKEYTPESLAAVINRLQETGKWTFTYLGSNQDLATIARTLNVPSGNLCSYSATPTGTKSAHAVAKCSAKRYFADRSEGATKVDSFYSTGGIAEVGEEAQTVTS